MSIDKDARIRELEAKLDEKNVRIGRLDDSVMRLTKAVEFRDAKIADYEALIREFEAKVE